MPHQLARALKSLLLVAGLLGGVVALLGVAVALGAPLPIGTWETPLRLLLQEHSLVLGVGWLPALIFAGAVWRIGGRARAPMLTFGLGLVGLLGTLLPLGQAFVAGWAFDRRLASSLGEGYQTALRETDASLQSGLIDLRLWLNIPTASGVDLRPVEIEYPTVHGQRLPMDLYRATEMPSPPLLVFLHGGGLEGGTRADMRLLAQRFASRGYLTASVDYRLAPEARVTDAVEDVLCAVAWLRENAADGAGDSWVGLVGFSSGGHLGLLAAYWSSIGYIPPECAQAEGAVRAVVAVAPVTDLSFYDESVIGFDPSIGSQEALLSSPILLARSGARSPPLLIVHGRLDDVVDVSQSEDFAAAVSQADGTIALLELPWSGHAFQALPGGLGSQVSEFYIDRFLGWSQAQGRD